MAEYQPENLQLPPEELSPELEERLRQVEIDAASAGENISRPVLVKYIGCGTFFFAMLAVPVIFFQLMISKDPVSPAGAVTAVFVCGAAGGLMTGLVAAFRPRREQ